MNRCDARRQRNQPGPYGFLPQRCRRTVGTLTWTDDAGRTHTACAVHVRELERRYPGPSVEYVTREQNIARGQRDRDGWPA